MAGSETGAYCASAGLVAGLTMSNQTTPATTGEDDRMTVSFAPRARCRSRCARPDGTSTVRGGQAATLRCLVAESPGSPTPADYASTRHGTPRTAMSRCG